MARKAWTVVQALGDGAGRLRLVRAGEKYTTRKDAQRRAALLRERAILNGEPNAYMAAEFDPTMEVKR